jgi:hypothetical protein
MDNALEKLANMASAIEGIGPSELKKALEFGAKETEGLAQDYAVRNYNASSVKTRTGELKSAVANGRLLLVGSKLNYSLKANKSKKFYIRANAVEYGAVRTSDGNKGTLKDVRNIKDAGTTTKLYRNIGDKRRAKVKKVLQGKIEKGTRAQKIAQGMTLDTGSVKLSKSGSISGQTSLGKVTVTKAIDYFKLSSRQQAVIVEEVVKEAWFFIENLIGRKVK